MRTKTHKLTVDQRSDTGELYDLVTDPQERNNLFDDPSAAEIRAELEGFMARRPDDMLPLQTQIGIA